MLNTGRVEGGSLGGLVSVPWASLPVAHGAGRKAVREGSVRLQGTAKGEEGKILKAHLEH